MGGPGPDGATIRARIEAPRRGIDAGRPQARPFAASCPERSHPFRDANPSARDRGLECAEGGARKRADRELRRGGPVLTGLPRPGDRHRDGQERPCWAEGRSDAFLHRHARVFRASKRGEPRRPRHDHPRRRDPRLLLVRRDRRARQYRLLLAALRRAPDRGDLQSAIHARPGRRDRAGAAAGEGSVPARARTHHLDHHAACARRLPRARTARKQGLHCDRLQGAASWRPARRAAEIRGRPDAQRRPPAARAEPTRPWPRPSW